MSIKVTQRDFTWFKRGTLSAWLSILFYFLPFIVWVKFVELLGLSPIGFLISILFSIVAFISIVQNTTEPLIKFVCEVIK